MIEIAEIAARQGCVNIQNYGITDEQALVRIAEIAVRQGFVNIQDYGITDERALIRIAEIVAAQSEWAISDDISNYQISDERALIRIAEIAAVQNGTATSHRIQNYQITDEQARIRIAETAAAQDGKGISQYIQNYQITDEQARIRIAETAAAQDGEGISEYIQNYQITDEQARIRIAETAAAQDGKGISQYIRNYQITDEQARIRIAETAAAQDGEGISQYIQNYQITDEQALIRIAKTALRQSVQSLWQVSNYGFSDEVLRSGEVVGPLFSSLMGILGGTEPNSESLHSDFRDFVHKACGRDLFYPQALGIDAGDWDNLEPFERVAGVAKRLQTFHPDFDDSLFDYQNEVQAEGLVAEALVATVCGWRHAQVERFGNNRARATLALLTGYDDLSSGILSPNATRELWGVLLAARDVIGPTLSNAVPVSFSDRVRALETITLASALRGLGGELPSLPDKIISNDDYNVVNSELRKRIGNEFSKVLNLESQEGDVVTKLLARWGGDLTPFTVLAGRFNTQERWRQELPVLSKIATHCLDGSFHDWRYRRDDEQLSMLSDTELRGWRENPSELGEYAVGEVWAEDAKASVVRNVQRVFQNNLFVHLPEQVAIESREVRLSESEYDRVCALAERDFIKEVSLATAVALIRHAIEREDCERLREVVKKANGVKESLLRGIEDPKQLNGDLKTLNDLTKESRGRAGSRYYVFSTITDDPKLLLMTGDLVQAASCQNYRSGSHIETLPGYVIDGNIKLALSYVVKAELVDKIRAKHPEASFSFDAARQVLAVAGSDDEIRLGYALRREVVRLGQIDSKGVVLIEPAYLQNHAISAEIEQQQRGLIQAFCAASGVRLQRAGEEASFAASRNPGGVYSDTGGGAMHSEYSIQR